MVAILVPSVDYKIPELCTNLESQQTHLTASITMNSLQLLNLSYFLIDEISGCN